MCLTAVTILKPRSGALDLPRRTRCFLTRSPRSLTRFLSLLRDNSRAAFGRASINAINLQQQSTTTDEPRGVHSSQERIKIRLYRRADWEFH
ncbi:hypothetical protein Sjap_023084 [Stephania japonica]|uniref:Uncharacterized protein n=1 Tax=Stephania japonica TaxID=461633 RepID=A0AAP0HU73_9MAGN